jgi:hypothetical protein
MAKKDKESKKAKKRAKKADKAEEREEKVEHRARQVGCKTTFPIFFIGSTRRAQGAGDCVEYRQTAGVAKRPL